MKQRNFFTALAFITLAGSSCGDKKIAKTPTTDPVTVSLVCAELPRINDGIVRNKVSLIADGKETQLTISEGSCQDIKPEKYAAAKIPSNAVAATGIQRMGGGSFYYVIIRDGKPVVFEGKQMVLASGVVYEWKEMPPAN